MGWTLLAIAALAVGTVSLRYLLPHVPFPAELPNFVVRHGWLVAHAGFSSIALLIGPWQFLGTLRSRWLTVHRWIGRVYSAAVAAGWITSLPIATHAKTGAAASAGFVTLGLLWISSTMCGYTTGRLRQLQRHREWMIRSYALTAAAITLRIYLPLSLISGIAYTVSYPIIAWACWIPNLLFAEWLIHRARCPIPNIASQKQHNQFA